MDYSKMDPIDAVRRRPQMYLGDTVESGAFHVLEELVANAIDQFLQGHADLVKIRHKGLRIEVYDNGNGFPISNPQTFKTLTSFHNKPTADDHAPHIHLGLHGVGLYPLNALSSRFSVQAVFRGETYEVCFERGRQVSKEVGLSLDFQRGTRVKAELDSEIFRCDGLRGDYVRKRLFETAHLFPGLAIELNAERFLATGLMQLAEIHRPYRDRRERTETIRRLSVVTQSERLRLNAALIGETRGSPTVCSWVNGVPTPTHGTHVEGALQATKSYNWRPQTVLVAVVFNEVQYAGPTKDTLSTPWVCNEVAMLLKEPLEEIFGSQE